MIAKDPRLPDMVLTDSTFKPINYATYGQASDFPAANPYAPRQEPLMGLHSVTARAGALAAHVEPKPMFALLMCASNPELFARTPTWQEEMLMVDYALAVGAKGIGYYWWNRLHQAPDADSLLRGLGRVNARVQQIGALAVNSVPTGWAKASGKTLVEGLWAAGEGLVVLLSNEDYTTDPSKDGQTVIRPQSNIRVSCRLPPGRRKWQLFRVTDLTRQPLAQDRFAIEQTEDGQRMAWTVSELEVARWFVITDRPF